MQRGDDGEYPSSTWTRNFIAMNTDNDSRLTQYVEQHGIDIDTLSIEERDDAELKLGKAGAFERRDMDEQADTLLQEVANMLGVQDEDTDTDTDTLSKETVAEYLDSYSLDTLNSQRKIEEKIETLESKISSLEARGVGSRVKELESEILALKGAMSEVDKSNKKYEDIDTLAGRVVREGSVLEADYTGDGVDLTSRDTGKTVTLSESGSGRYLTEPKMKRGNE